MMNQKKYMHKLTAGLIAAALLAAGLTGCGGETQNTDTPENASASQNGDMTVNIAYFDSFVWGYYIQIAQEYGIWDKIFGEDDVKVNLTGFATGPEINEAITAGNIDIALYTQCPFFQYLILPANIRIEVRIHVVFYDIKNLGRIN